MGERSESGDVADAQKPFIFSIRSQRVIIDADLARLYGVSTMRLNEAVKRNRGRFPDDFAFRLTSREHADLISQIAISRQQSIDSTGRGASARKAPRGGRRHLPWAFTEHGALMAANILRSQHAVRMSIFVIRAFVRLRERIAANEAILRRLAEIDKTLIGHDNALRDIYRKLLPLLQPPPDPPRRRIGFHVESM